MKKRMIAGMMFLVLTVSGCSAVSTAPTTINELAEETRAETETESTDSILPSESEKADAPVESKSPEETVPFPVSWTVKMKKKQKETQDILSYHTQAAGCSDKARAKASGGRQPIEECGRTGL